MKKLLLIIALTIFGLGLNAQNVGDVITIANLEFKITSFFPFECEVSDYSGNQGFIIIPSTVEISGTEYSVTSIGWGAFNDYSSLTSIEIPNSVAYIREWAFSGCSSLTSVTFGENSQLISIGYHAFDDCSSLTSIEIPNSVTSIGSSTFYGCSSLTSVTFGENSQLTSIGYSAFSGCSSLTSIEIPNSVTSIGYEAFYNCSNLVSVIFEENSQLTTIAYHTFSGCSLTSIEIPNSVTTIGNFAFEDCLSLASIEIPNTVTSIGCSVFSGCLNLTSMVVEEGNPVYDSRDNSNAIIETATNTLISGYEYTIIPNSVTSIGNDAFSGCSSLTSIEIPNSVTTIGLGAFNECTNLANVTFEENSQLTSIGYVAFSSCSSLTSIEIPNSVTSIGDQAFSSCSSLRVIKCYADNVPETECNQYYCSVFGGCPSDMTIYVPMNSVQEYKAADLWNDYNIVGSCKVSVSANNKDYGTVEGGDLYEAGEKVTVKAIANQHCYFINWTENDNVVSTNAEYTFYAVNPDRNLVANFVKISVPENIEATALSASSVSLSWDAVEDADSYNVYRDGKLLKNVNTNSYLDEGLEAYTEYCYAITAVHANGEESEKSSAACATTFDLPITTPENLIATPTSASSVSLSWDAVEDADSYNVYRDGKLLKNVNTNSYLDEGLEAYTEYCYAITAVRSETETDKSEEVCTTTFDLPITTPENLIATPTSASSVSLSWDAVEDADSYNVYRDGKLLKNVNTNSYLDEGLEAYTEYCYEITAVRNEIETDKSEEVCTTTFDLPITTPENLEANALSASSIILTWDNVENAESYNVYRDGNSIANVANPTYTDKDLEYNTKYCYEVAAVRGDEESEKSKMVCAKTLGESIEELSLSINIYPNPVDNELFLATEVSVEEIAIYDVYGRQIMSQQVNETASQQVVEVADLEAGVYFVKVVTNEGEIVKRFVKK